MKATFILILSLLLHDVANCQIKDSAQIAMANTLQSYNNLPDKSLSVLQKRYASMEGEITANSQKLLTGMQKSEAKLNSKMLHVDSSKAKQIFAGSQDKYQQLSHNLQSPVDPSIIHPFKEYLPGMDSISTAMKFLQQANSKMPGVLSPAKLQHVEALSTQLQSLESKMQQAKNIQDFAKQREQELSSQLSKYGLGKQLLSINKQNYYYQQQFAQYKAALSDKKAIETKALNTVEKLPAFQSFMKRNSYFAQLFGVPGGDAESSVAKAIPGLQTNMQVQGIIAQQTGNVAGAGSSVSPQQLMQQGTSAEGLFSQMKAKISSMGGNSNDMEMPNFQPNNQKTKTFLNRIEYSFNIQSQKGTSWIPATSDIGVSTGYKLTDKATIGTGISYKMGWGTGFKHISLSSQGAGLRSYVDIKAKGSMWVTGGYEYNYFSSFAGISELKDNPQNWQKSALLGITKKYKAGKQNCNMQLLYDFLCNQQVPKGTAFKFRLGYSL
jgi:hypothetical protein